jgi:hypothetical protein
LTHSGRACYVASATAQINARRSYRRQEEKEKLIPPMQINDFDHEAYRVSDRFGGVLYVLKGNAFV